MRPIKLPVHGIILKPGTSGALNLMLFSQSLVPASIRSVVLDLPWITKLVFWVMHTSALRLFKQAVASPFSPLSRSMSQSS